MVSYPDVFQDFLEIQLQVDPFSLDLIQFPACLRTPPAYPEDQAGTQVKLNQGNPEGSSRTSGTYPQTLKGHGHAQSGLQSNPQGISQQNFGTYADRS